MYISFLFSFQSILLHKLLNWWCIYILVKFDCKISPISMIVNTHLYMGSSLRIFLRTVGEYQASSDYMNTFPWYWQLNSSFWKISSSNKTWDWMRNLDSLILTSNTFNARQGYSPDIIQTDGLYGYYVTLKGHYCRDGCSGVLINSTKEWLDNWWYVGSQWYK